jgi:hypothetical protein
VVADRVLPAGQPDRAGAVDQSVYLDRDAGLACAGGQGCQTGRTAAVGEQLVQVDDGKPGRDGLEPDAVGDQVHQGVSAHRVMVVPARSGPSQNCCPPTVRFPEAGTVRSTSTAT